MHSGVMDAREYWDDYVKRAGGLLAVSERLGIPYSTIACICNGSRGIGHRLAQRMVASDPGLDVDKLIWVRPNRVERPPIAVVTPLASGRAEVA
jgi:hypothetical protein